MLALATAVAVAAMIVSSPSLAETRAYRGDARTVHPNGTVLKVSGVTGTPTHTEVTVHVINGHRKPIQLNAGRVPILALAGLASTAQAGPSRPLRVVTYNLFHGGPYSEITGNSSHLEARLEMVARQLESLRPDIVGLQEDSVGRARGHVAARLARRLGLHQVHGPATSRVFPLDLASRLAVWLIGFNEGQAILSRFPITSWDVFDLPRCQKRLDPRVLLRAEVSTPWGPLQVFSTHTSRDDCQVRLVGEIVRERRGPLPSIVTGDFNTVEWYPVMAELRQTGFVDAFRAANQEASGLTVWQRVEVPKPTVFRRVDYIFLVPGRQVQGRVLSSRVVLDEPGQGPDGALLWPSDHYGVLAEVGL